ncbi:Acyl-CoA N-acyltransferases (Nat) [Glarea lozoyensis ATCC 20868]|uniref:Ornithine decarboxylase antizyme n=1 Tax=Glarea lozoyensis (strain ATCC 20868 / MF5171) TaxID=1116229 RepID=S3CSC5_GLAL2|nr:Acyl-CoA N-acyltransferases (Nat) [Glarea lozoyensis ATCC 20868]EPE28580.1 Acyl-CoA N-acyltransferases (Nat) [Glarea lozoyensis ATCC 20868]
MSPSKNDSHSTSNRNGESVGRQTNVLASAYCITPLPAPAGQSGIPEVISGLPSPPSSPPLAALTSANEFALISKPKKSRDNDHNGSGMKSSRRGGASYSIREECERLFCETMKDVFLGEEGLSSSNGSIVMDTIINTDTRSTPPVETRESYGISHQRSRKASNFQGQEIDAWIEIWDYAGGCSFRGFVGGNGENKSLFAFFDSSVIGRDLKQGLMALIEMAETVFALEQVVVCVDRSVEEADCKSFLKSLRWVGFEAVTLDIWASRLDVTSDKWLFLGMEI